MEKRTPHTRLSQVKKLVNAGQVRTTRSALLNADELGLDFDGMCNVIIGLSESDFGNDSNLLIVFYVQIMPDDFVMQLHR
ncbi:type II toxin-antitoxin system MqsR family toxin, partial [Escherichia coli]|uniref:type II toxin-antitoxin system MqsR family toxin n=1 Tax=Escherichia coli TaxID=562 RepID=UPI001FCEBB9C